MNWHYDVTGAEPIIRDIPVYAAAALTRGTAMCSGPVATAVNPGRSIVADPVVLSNIIGVLQEDVTAANALAVAATGYETFAKHIINPFAVYLAAYSELTADQNTVSVADSTGKTITAADTGTADQEGYWFYVTDYASSTGGFGNLFCAGATTGTTVLTAVTSYDDYLNGNVINDRYIGLYARYGATAVGGAVNLATNAKDLAGPVATGPAGSAIVLENYIESSRRSLTPLVISEFSGKNYKSEDPRFYGDVMFSEHLLVAGGVVNTRVIN